MPTLYNQADSNVRKTFLLITLFAIFIILLGWLFSCVLDSSLFLYLSLVISISLSISSYWFSDKIVLSTTGAKPIEKSDNPDLYRIVENICLTTGLPMPKIYILEEAQPNAFATGRDENHAVVAITRGLLQKLERIELEGVIAHEMAHIKNRDILLQTVIVVLVGSVAIISNFFFRFSFGRDREEKNIVFVLLGLAAAILAPIAATILQLAISRQREFLADASGALITRYPEGLASALEKISADPTPMKHSNNSVAHLFIESPLKGDEQKGWMTKLFATHPPIEERIAALRGMSKISSREENENGEEVEKYTL